jgi:hypothetical protein
MAHHAWIIIIDIWYQRSVALVRNDSATEIAVTTLGQP